MPTWSWPSGMRQRLGSRLPIFSRVRLRGVVRNRAGDRYGVEVKATSAAEKEQLTLFQPILARWDGA